MRKKSLTIWLMSIVIGLCGAVGAILFRSIIDGAKWLWLMSFEPMTNELFDTLPWWLIVGGPMIGGLFVGVLIHFLMPSNRTYGVADVIEARAVGGKTIDIKTGLISSLINAMSLGFGASAGREGPIVHLGATLAKAVSGIISISASERRILLACGVAAAISASFNTPIAGVLFAHEVILAHYALSALLPIVLSSTFAIIATKIIVSDFEVFSLPNYQIVSFLEVPAFLLLGLTCAAAAIIFQFAIIGGDWVSRRISMPIYVRTCIGGLAVGIIALAFPQVLGVGYDAISQALNQSMELSLMLMLIIAKSAATAITMASRFSVGIVSPSLFIGVMTGGAFGAIATALFPDYASSVGLYAILGMAAVGSAILGAPLSTTVMVFELTGGFEISVILLLTASLASGLTQAVHGMSIFHWQLHMRGIILSNGNHMHVVRNTFVEEFMRRNLRGDPIVMLDESLMNEAVTPFDTLEKVLRNYDQYGVEKLPVLMNYSNPTVIGWAHQVDALSAYNKALVDLSIEEHQ